VRSANVFIWLIIGVALAAVLVFYIRNFYCWCEERNYTFHPLLLPAGCEVLSIPEPWLDSRGSEIEFPGLVVDDVNPMMFGVYEFRRTATEGEFLIALQSKFLSEMKDRAGPLPPSHYSRNKFAFQFPWMEGKPGKIHSVRTISTGEWDAGTTMVMSEMYPTGYGDYEYRNGANLVKGKHFPHSNTYDWGARLSPSGKRVAVLSYGGELEGDAKSGWDLIARPLQRCNIDVYEWQRGVAERKVRGWTCTGASAFFPYAVWHDDRLFAMMLDGLQRRALVCGFKSK
jgi:hypothetical protein